MATVKAVLDTTQYVQVSVEPGSFILQSHRDTVRIVFSDVKPALGNTAFHELGGKDSPLTVNFTEEFVWALAMTDRSSLSVTEQRAPIEFTERDSMGVSVFVNDQTTPTLSLHFLQERATTSIPVDTVRDTRVVTLSPGHGALVDDVLQITDTITGEFIQTDILSILGDDVTVDAPMNKVYTPANSDVILAIEDLLVDGSVIPQIFKILPIPSQSGDMVAVNFTIEGTADQDFTTFGSDVALTIGCVLRTKNQAGDFRNLLTFRTNGDIIEHSGSNTFLTPKGGNSTRGFFSKITWGGQHNHGVVIRLDGALNEELQIVIQDDLTAGSNTSFQMVAQGSELQE